MIHPIRTFSLRRLLVIAVALSLLLVSACGDDIDRAAISEPTVPLTIQTHVASNAKGRSAFVDTVFPLNSRLGVALIKSPSESGASVYNQSSCYALTARNSSAETWQVEAGINGLFVSTQKAVAVAYYPVGETNILSFSGDVAFISPSILASNDMGNLEGYMIGGGIGVQFGDEVVKISPYENDYLVGKGTSPVSSGTPTATLQLEHALAMVSVRIIRADNYYGEGELTSFVIANAVGGRAPLKKGSIRVDDRSFTPGTENVSYTRTFSGYHVEEDSEYNDRVGFLAFPANIEPNDLAITLTVDGKTYQTTNTGAIQFQAGCLTRLNITVKASEIELNTSILVENWTSTKDQEFEIQ